ncbi:DNA adenine methylase [Metamycoplasma equirhinis]|uniref:DNA adenine methylase n=1 Tax=Metamycoplasma equirhinis TaxID=92402 RepID=UPI002573C44C|nr:DNA adenine methylase [Metamycoplasma equirhinis]BDX52602.1 DNA methyltransferase [Metamycoplasma equirhinis]
MKLDNWEKVKPVFKLVGSKFKLLEWLFVKFNLQNYNVFIDLFGGTGIVGINVKNLFPEKKVIINDYDKILKPFNFEKAILSQCKFNGIGTITELGLNQFATKIQNGYFGNIQTYKRNLEKCEIINCEATNFLESFVSKYEKTLIYMDIPYWDEKEKNSNLYINKLNINKFLKTIIKFMKLNKNVTLALSINNNKDVLTKLSSWTKYAKRISNANTCHIKSSTEYLLIWNPDEN